MYMFLQVEVNRGNIHLSCFYYVKANPVYIQCANFVKKEIFLSCLREPNLYSWYE